MHKSKIEKSQHPLIVICGPTASGKTSLAVEMALRFNGEIISADSRQVYRGLDLGSGKDMADYVVKGVAVPAHLIDIADAGSRYSIYDYNRDMKIIVILRNPVDRAFSSYNYSVNYGHHKAYEHFVDSINREQHIESEAGIAKRKG